MKKSGRKKQSIDYKSIIDRKGIIAPNDMYSRTFGTNKGKASKLDSVVPFGEISENELRLSRRREAIKRNSSA